MARIKLNTFWSEIFAVSLRLAQAVSQTWWAAGPC